jgi:hypothetical protein
MTRKDLRYEEEGAQGQREKEIETQETAGAGRCANVAGDGRTHHWGETGEWKQESSGLVRDSFAGELRGGIFKNGGQFEARKVFLFGKMTAREVFVHDAKRFFAVFVLLKNSHNVRMGNVYSYYLKHRLSILIDDFCSTVITICIPHWRKIFNLISVQHDALIAIGNGGVNIDYPLVGGESHERMFWGFIGGNRSWQIPVGVQISIKTVAPQIDICLLELDRKRFSGGNIQGGWRMRGRLDSFGLRFCRANRWLGCSIFSRRVLCRGRIDGLDGPNCASPHKSGERCCQKYDYSFRCCPSLLTDSGHCFLRSLLACALELFLAPLSPFIFHISH